MNFKSKIYILDGAMGTMLQKKGLTGCSELHNLEAPESVLDIHREYIAAGADIIETNTFGANPIVQSEHGYAHLAGEMAYRGALIARQAADEADRKIYVAGSIGPTSKSLSIGTDADDPSAREISFAEMEEAYRTQIDGLARGGVDLFLIETAFDALNVKAAIRALEGHKEIPVIISAAVSDLSSRVLTGQSLEAFYTSIRHCNPLAFGLNCSLGADKMKPLMEEVASFTDCATICFPNAGLPNEMGAYDQSPEEMAGEMSAMSGLFNIAGGCCGTTPDHIKAIAGILKGKKPRVIPEKKESNLKVSGLDAVTIDLKNNNFTNIGERTNVAGSRKFARLISEEKYKEAIRIAISQVENGASIIDINMDDAMLDSAVQMERFVRIISGEPEVAKAALMIDSSDWDTVLAGIRNAQGKCIVNSISLKEGEEVFLRKALEIKSYGAAMVVMAFDEKGQATDYKSKISICERAYRLLTGAGINPHDIIFDVNVLSIGTGVDSDRRYAVDFIDAVRWIKENLPNALTSGGISNLSFAFRGNNPVREAMHSVFLYHAIKAGLDMAIVNPGMLRIYDEIEPDLLKAVEDVIFDADSNATARLLEVATKNLQTESSREEITEKQQNGDVSERLSRAIIKGDDSTLADDIEKALSEYPDASAIIEGPLMKGMEQVGTMFECGKMFLPQVVKSARIMKEAVDILQPHIVAQESDSREGTAPVAVIATVKGDVHDIGKNITATVLTCNGFRVFDLGVMVERDFILEAAEKYRADIICLSGLITPSLSQMEDMCREMSARDMDTPLFVGGATTSDIHTAVKLASLYKHVFHGTDASSTAVMAKKCICDRKNFEEQEHIKQEKLRNLYKPSEKKVCVPVGRCLAWKDFDQSCELPCGNIPVSDVLPFMDWGIFYTICGIKGSEREGLRARSLRQQAERELGTISLDIRAGMHFVPATGKDGFILAEDKRLEAPLSCFLPQDRMGVLGIFAASVRCSSCCNCVDMTHKAICLSLADAVSGWMKSRIYVPDGYKVILPGIGYGSCPDHSQKKDLLAMLPNSEKLGIHLTETYAMIPQASVCGFVSINTEAKYL